MNALRDTHATRAGAPLRLGLAGGGTDLAPFSDEFGGAVLNCTIDRYAFAFLTPRNDGRLVFRAKDLDTTESFDDPTDVVSSGLALHRGVYLRMVRDYMGGRHPAMTVTTSVDAPMGSGLGSSSALVVALVEAFRTLLDLPLGQYDVAHLAFEIERIDLGLSGGKQDQYAAAFGGTNFIEFLPGDRVVVNPLRLPEWVWNELESSLVVAFTGQSRSSAAIIDRQKSAMVSHDPTAIEALHRLKADALEMKSRLLLGDIMGMGTILDRSWQAKKATAAGVTNSRIDDLYALARANGAIAGKVSGAGGGGFMMFIAPPEDRFDVVQALNAAGADAGPVKFTDRGCESWRMKC
jgi:D-glycero-alpha-D-manno-heptose-7-phosphate kinase